MVPRTGPEITSTLARPGLRRYRAPAASGVAAGRCGRGARSSAEADVTCRANSSGTAAVGISASGSVVITATALTLDRAAGPR
jgi:hypothetical protein